MKLGELKIECAMHLFPNNKIPYASDDQSILDTLDSLRSDPNLSDLMVTMTGALNRAITLITVYGLTEKKRVDLSQSKWERVMGTYQTPIDTKELFSVEWAGAPCEIIDGYLVLLSEEFPKYIIYRKKHPEITQASSDLMELELSDALCHLIPIYVKGELYSLDSEERKQAQEEFKSLLATYRDNISTLCHTVSQVYKGA